MKKLHIIRIVREEIDLGELEKLRGKAGNMVCIFENEEHGDILFKAIKNGLEKSRRMMMGEDNSIEVEI